MDRPLKPLSLHLTTRASQVLTLLLASFVLVGSDWGGLSGDHEDCVHAICVVSSGHDENPALAADARPRQAEQAMFDQPAHAVWHAIIPDLRHANELIRAPPANS